MTADILIFVSKRGQRVAAAILAIMLLHGIMASCTPEPVSPMAARIDLTR
jgi:hypothetical protein